MQTASCQRGFVREGKGLALVGFDTMTGRWFGENKRKKAVVLFWRNGQNDTF